MTSNIKIVDKPIEMGEFLPPLKIERHWNNLGAPPRQRSISPKHLYNKDKLPTANFLENELRKAESALSDIKKLFRMPRYSALNSELLSKHDLPRAQSPIPFRKSSK